jgi:hypothetical protein
MLRELYLTFSDSMAVPKRIGPNYTVARVIWSGNKDEGINPRYVSRRTANGSVGEHSVNLLRDKIYELFIRNIKDLKLIDKRGANLTYVG